MAKGDYVASSSGGVRILYVASMGLYVREVGISSLNGFGTYPTGAAVYRAVQTSPTDRDGFLTVRVTGIPNVEFGDPRYYSEEEQTYSRNINKQDAMDELSFIRGGQGGDGYGNGDKLSFDTDDRWPNTFLRLMSEMTGFGWGQISTVQVF